MIKSSSEKNIIEISLEKWVPFYEGIVLFSMFINFSVILSSGAIIIINLNSDNIVETPPTLDFIIWAVGFFSNIFISIFGVLISIENIKIDNIIEIKVIKNNSEPNIVNKPKSPSCFFKLYYLITDLFKNYKNTEMSFKAFEVVKKLNTLKLPESLIKKIESPKTPESQLELYNTIINFKHLVKCNLLYRVSMGNYLNLITLIFFYFNGIMFFVPYYNQDMIVGTPKKIVEIFMSVLNQIFSLVFSYIAIVCENVNYLNAICDEIAYELEQPLISEIKISKKIYGHFDNIINPLNTIFKKKSDLEKEQETHELIKTISFFGNPK